MCKDLTPEEIQEYRLKIKTTREINSRYENLSKEELAKVSPSFNLIREDLEGERWEKYRDNQKLEVSNLGRVRYSDTKEILEQVDIAKLKGYLYLKDYKEIQKRLKFKFQDEYVFQMVAKTFKTKPQDSDAIWDIHHIDNDGYNNREENLKYVSRDDHNKIHWG